MSTENIKRLTVGILAHVDAGKTTLSEALLYQSGVLRKLGRVDHQNAFLDTDTQERARGITIFSKNALLTVKNSEFLLIDTPGHVDFSAEAERTLQVLDYAVLVISATDGVQSHTRTLWQLLSRFQVPTFLFINKTDLPNSGQRQILADLRKRIDNACIDFNTIEEASFHEEAATCSESALDEYLSIGRISAKTLRNLISERKLFPCYFGSALHLEGVDLFLNGLSDYTQIPDRLQGFGARVYKITRDTQGARLTWLKVTGGTLPVKTMLCSNAKDSPWKEKADQLRLYSGNRYQLLDEAAAGTVCAVTGLTHTYAGQGLGLETDITSPTLEPVMTYQVTPPEECNLQVLLQKLRLLEEEDPLLHVSFDNHLHEVRVQLMGEVQKEVLAQILLERFCLNVVFGPGKILYRETISEPVEGIGHYEPLRHYAEVHLMLEPGTPGSGLEFAANCPESQLDRTWQRLVLSHLAEKEHLGVLTGAPLTDVRITLIAGRASVKHTEGGDFRQATYRAVRQGLMHADNVLLEPWYNFRLDLPREALGRAISDLQAMNAVYSAPQIEQNESYITGSSPVASIRDYAKQVASYTHGEGRLTCVFHGYEPCREQEQIVLAASYDPAGDVENTPDSVFCSHGAGHIVRWDEVPAHADVDCYCSAMTKDTPIHTGGGYSEAYSASSEQDRELQAIFERTYGPVRRRDFLSRTREQDFRATGEGFPKTVAHISGPEYLLVDGYNIIFAWPELKAVADESLEAARQLLTDLLCNYRGYRRCQVILVFDAYKVPDGIGEVTTYCGVTVVYTKEAETADTYIEKATYRLAPENRVRVATSDGAEQLIILCHGAQRISADSFREEVIRTEGEISAIIARSRVRERNDAFRAAMEKAEKK